MKRSGTVLIALGILGIAAALLSDIVRTGRLQIQAAQILVIEIGAFLIALGLVLRQMAAENQEETGRIVRLAERLNNLPLTTWILIGFLITYVLFFITPMFFGLPPRMQYFNKYLPDRFPIGNDLLVTINLLREWFETNQTPFHNEFYPPFTYVFLSPLLLMDDYNILFRVVTLTTIVSFLVSSLLIPLAITDRKDKSLVLAFFLMGLFSYGMQFEIERGQINVLAFLFVMSAIYIYHRHPAFRRYAYLLFTIAVQLKIYPAIFVVMFIRDWRDWKGNLRRFVALGLFNFSLLFITGVRPFLEFLNAVSTQMASPGWAWTGNHSIRAFISEFVENGGFGLVHAGVLDFIRQNSGIISNAFLAVFLVCFLSVLARAYRRNQAGIDTSLLLVCLIGALIIPISNDYKLSILPAPMALALTEFSTARYAKNKPAAIVLLLLATIASSAVMYPFKYKAPFLQNSFPWLFVVLLCVTLLDWLMQDCRRETDAAAGMAA